MFRKVDVVGAKTLMAEGVDVIDVREPHEWVTGHIPGARLLSLGALRADPDGARLGQRVLFVCERGGRSQHAAELADARGVEAFSLEGGTLAWKEAGEPTSVPEALPADAADQELDAVVGQNMKRLRERYGWTLDVLAGMSGVSRQVLGQIELGRTMPSLGTLWKISRAFELPFSALIARPSTQKTRVFRAAGAKKIEGADGRFTSRALFSPDDRGGFELYEVWLAPHAREDAEGHIPGTRENLLVTSGQLVLEIGAQKERYELGKGDAIAFTADVPHAYINPGNQECLMSLVMTYPAPPK